MQGKAGDRRHGGGGGRDEGMCITALVGCRAAVRVLGSASLRAGAGGRRRAYSGIRRCAMLNWARGCAVPGGRTPPLGRRHARAQIGRSRVACIGVCAVSARARPRRGLHCRVLPPGAAASSTLTVC